MTIDVWWCTEKKLLTVFILKDTSDKHLLYFLLEKSGRIPLQFALQDSKSSCILQECQICNFPGVFIRINTDLHRLICTKQYEPQYVKTNKVACAPSEDSDLPSLIRVVAVRMKKLWVFSYPTEHTVRTLADLSLSLGTQVILLVLLCCGSYYEFHVHWHSRPFIWKYQFAVTVLRSVF